jgi:hypothetical protein
LPRPEIDSVDSGAPVEKRTYNRQGQAGYNPTQRGARVAFEEKGVAGRYKGENDDTGGYESPQVMVQRSLTLFDFSK